MGHRYTMTLNKLRIMTTSLFRQFQDSSNPSEFSEIFH
jgi:hypothetical protein